MLKFISRVFIAKQAFDWVRDRRRRRAAY